MKILIIEDDTTLLETLETSLEMEGFSVKAVSDGLEGLKQAESGGFDIICMDLVVPSLNGFEICRQLREKNINTPILFLSGEKKDEIDRITGLNLGADDYLLKPFNIRELVARIHAILRRTKSGQKDISEYRFGNVSVDFRKHVIIKGNNSTSVTAKEISLLKYLIEHEGEVVSRDQILNEVWGYEAFPTTRTVDTFIHGLRKKLEDDPAKPRHLLTIPWVGYKFIG